ncbi:bifunctional protein-serine/threonine kinase/phosphatase [Ketobacter sp. MCCC 1A13808]|uniref:bifunctional protein-serine/threonine kinase/phosphatase n=1 Tax=Ketobacter sp. MCCC 1A13808 TaxID=2602738 RepID=UPI0012EB9232|nr:bifunctional protein-serine/threonine kinase/phosphatase [Ketobacter sp. MCCC 1A13808]MVF11541.1 bifunctional protein-serine/threonine kinase/phosphatase [Ketobacter sp. MCCC 1A13808]
MPNQLQLSIGQHSDKGRKEINQDFHGVMIPKEPLLSTKGVAIALADGISTSEVSQIASEAAVTGFLSDYYCTSEAWSVSKSAQRVLLANNSWLHAQTRQSQYRYERDKGYVCTFSGMVIKSNTAHFLHVGDSRIYRLRDKKLVQLTEDHRFWVSQEQSYLSRAMGINQQVEIDYYSQPTFCGDVYILATDGVYEFADTDYLLNTIIELADDLNRAAAKIVDQALQQGSDDNLTIQIVRVDAVPDQTANEIVQQLTALPFPDSLQPRDNIDGYTIVRELYASSRSHVYLATDDNSGKQIVLKTPSVDLRHDAAYLEQFLMEEWIARRINSAYVLKPSPQDRKRHFFYIALEYIEGQSLAQWMIDHPKPDVESVRQIIEQIVKGLRAFHRMEMLHQDLRPENILIDQSGTVKIIDFGSTRVAGLLEMDDTLDRSSVPGAIQYAAPEYFLGEPGSEESDQFSLAVIAYQMLCGRLPYGTQIPKIRNRKALRSLSYQSVLDEERDIPVWIDHALRKALNPDRYKRYEDLFEFVHELRHPGRRFLSQSRPPLIERDPLRFWKGYSLILTFAVLFLLYDRFT